MMFKILQRINSDKKQKIVNSILNVYENKSFCTIHFLYFAQIISQRIIPNPKSKNTNNKKNKKNDNFFSKSYQKLFPDVKKLLDTWLLNTTPKNYHQELLWSDFLLPDGIALQILFFVLRLRKYIKKPAPFFLHNLNWTDFVPYFLNEVVLKYGEAKPCIVLYWGTEEVNNLTKKYFSYKWFNVVYAQDWYREFDWSKAENTLKEYKDSINILLVARSTTELPIQELWVQKRNNKIKKNQLITFTVGWLFEFLTGVEKRAPKIMRICKLEWLCRIIINPKKNLKKTKTTFLIFRYFFCYLVLKKRKFSVSLFN